MSSVNTHFTFNYSQPDEYRFSHDSVFLARQSFELTSIKDFSGKRALDIGAGSGIVGLDFLCHRQQNQKNLPEIFDFLEIQDVYRPHFEKNKTASGLVNCQLNFVNRNYADLQMPEYKSVYDLVLANPPYFFTEHGLLSPNDFKNRCRFFIDSDLPSLLLGVAQCLAPEGEAYLLLRDQPQHGFNTVTTAEKICAGRLTTELLGEIRGTLFLRFKRIS